MSLIRRGLESRGVISWGPYGAGPFINGRIPPNSWANGGAYTFGGPLVNDDTSLQMSTVWACVRLISESVAMLPAAAFRKLPNGGLAEVAPTPSLLSKPFDDLTFMEWVGQGTVSLLLRGNFYAHVVDRDRSGYPVQLMPLHPDRVYVRTDPQSGSVTYTANGVDVPRDDMFHVRGMTMPGHHEGLSPLQYARQTIGLGLAAVEFGARFFGDGATPSGVLTSDQPITEDQAEDTKRRWMQRQRGSREPAVLGFGVKYNTISVTPEESQFIATRAFQVEDIARIYGVPLHMVQHLDKGTSWGTGVEEQGLGYATYTLGGWLKRWQAALSAVIPGPQFVKFDISDLLRGRVLDQYQAFAVGIQNQFLVPDEARSKIDLPPLPNGAGAKPVKLNATAPVSPQPQTTAGDSSPQGPHPTPKAA